MYKNKSWEKIMWFWKFGRTRQGEGWFENPTFWWTTFVDGPLDDINKLPIGWEIMSVCDVNHAKFSDVLRSRLYRAHVPGDVRVDSSCAHSVLWSQPPPASVRHLHGLHWRWSDAVLSHSFP